MPYTKNQLTDILVGYQVKKYELNGGLVNMKQEEREEFFENKTKQLWVEGGHGLNKDGVSTDAISKAWIDASKITSGTIVTNEIGQGLNDLVYRPIEAVFKPMKLRVRGFEVVAKEHRKHPDADIQLPTRGSATSAGYDVYLPCDVVLEPYEHKMVMSDVKSYMQPGEVLMAFPRSSLGFKKGLVLRNTVGIIDSDYYQNPSNDGNIGLALHNHSDDRIVLKAGERVGQLIFIPFLVADTGNTDAERSGGFGSTGTN